MNETNLCGSRDIYIYILHNTPKFSRLRLFKYLYIFIYYYVHVYILLDRSCFPIQSFTQKITP